MRYPELRFRWEWRLQASPERLWPFVADTNRFNRDTGLPTVQTAAWPGGGALANARRLLRFSRFGARFEWEEEPFEWLEPIRFGVRRRYRVGPVAEVRVQVELAPLANGGTRLMYTTWVRPRGLLGLLGAPVALELVTRRSFDAAFHRYDALAARPTIVPETGSTSPAHLTSGGDVRVAAIERQLTETVGPPDLVARLVEVVARADDLTVAHLRPYALADAWGVPRRQVLELCLHATRAGLFDLQWDLICPLCRGAKASHSALAEVTQGVHCDTCNIDVSANVERSVELTFRPSATIRRVEGASYCVAGPRVTPHVVAQQLLRAGEERAIAPRLEPGRYRLRALGLGGDQFLVATPGGAAAARLAADSGGWPQDEASVSLAPTLRLVNATGAEQLFILERTAWSDQAATAAAVTTLQVFRDLFSRELLRPGEQISVGSLTVVFTDLRDSTSFYRQIGDAPAFGRVLDHFGVLREEIARADGALVKTIGDAIMAVFRRPSSALRAMLAAQRRLAVPPDGATPLALKVGMHHGPCIAVTLNDRLDYFGSVVNLASRLERFSSGNDVVVSDAVRCDPEVAALLSDAASALGAERFATQLRGFDEQEFGLWRVFSASRREGELPGREPGR